MGRQRPSDELKATYRPTGRPIGPRRHGSPAGYLAHRRDETEPCDLCRAAWREDERRRRAARAERDHVKLGRPRVATNPDVVARIVDDRAAGLSYAAIAAHLAGDSVPPPGSATRWWPTTVKAIAERAADPDSAAVKQAR